LSLKCSFCRELLKPSKLLLLMEKAKFLLAGSTRPVNAVDSAVIVSNSATDLKTTLEDLIEYTCLTDA
ncbi:MAG: hypothetical protein RLZZ94_115, partial [Bacteroidota bacterium]